MRILLCPECAAAIRAKRQERKAGVSKLSQAKTVSANSKQVVSISRASNNELDQLANAVEAGQQTLKRVNKKMCQRCVQRKAVLKANLGDRGTVILCELVIASRFVCVFMCGY